MVLLFFRNVVHLCFLVFFDQIVFSNSPNFAQNELVGKFLESFPKFEKKFVNQN